MEDLQLHYFILTNCIKAPFSMHPTPHQPRLQQLLSTLQFTHTNKINNVFEKMLPNLLLLSGKINFFIFFLKLKICTFCQIFLLSTKNSYLGFIHILVGNFLIENYRLYFSSFLHTVRTTDKSTNKEKQKCISTLSKISKYSIYQCQFFPSSLYMYKLKALTFKRLILSFKTHTAPLLSVFPGHT